MQRIAEKFKKAKTFKCRRCKEEYQVLNARGVCFNCEQELENEKIAKNYLMMMIGELGVEMNFENFKVIPENRDAFNKLIRFNPEKENLFLYGKAGRGKTHLAISALSKLYDLKSYYKYHFVKAPQLADHFRLLDPSQKIKDIRTLVNKRVLVIDDFGVSKFSEFVMETLYNIVDGRIMRKRNGLIITSNFDFRTIQARFGDDRLTSRFYELCSGKKGFVVVGGPDWRLEGK